MTRDSEKSMKMFKDFKKLIKESKDLSIELITIGQAQAKVIERLDSEKKQLQMEIISLRNKLIERSEAFRHE